MTARPTLEEARARLKELGYLDVGVSRLLFRPLFEGRVGAFLPAVLLGAFAAALAAVAAVEASEPGFGGSLSSVAALFVHVFLADLLPLAAAALADRLGVGPRAAAGHRRDGGGPRGGERGVRASGSPGPTASRARSRSARCSGAFRWRWRRSSLAAAVRLGFLARAFARSGSLPVRARRPVFLAACAAGLLVAILLFSARREAPAADAPRPSPRQIPVVVLAIDGLDLDGPGKPARVAELLAGGATGWWPAEKLSPPEIWTDLATGEPAGRHGVRALARVRPLGSPLALRPPFGTSWYLRGVGPRLHLVSNAPVSGADRRRLDFWEVAASAGIPSLSIGWWAAAPWPGATVVENRAIFARAGNGVEADRVAIEMFEAEARKGYGVPTVYLPGCDIARDDPAARKAAVERSRRCSRTGSLRAAQGECVLVVLAVDSHPRLGGGARPDGRLRRRPRARHRADPAGGRRAVDPRARRRSGGGRPRRASPWPRSSRRARSKRRPSRRTARASCRWRRRRPRAIGSTWRS